MGGPSLTIFVFAGAKRKSPAGGLWLHKIFYGAAPSLGASYVTKGKVSSLLYFRCCLYFNYGLVLEEPPPAALSMTILFLPEREKIERMKKRMKKTAALWLTVFLFSAFFCGCQGDPPPGNAGSGESVSDSSSVPVPSGGYRKRGGQHRRFQ